MADITPIPEMPDTEQKTITQLWNLTHQILDKLGEVVLNLENYFTNERFKTCPYLEEKEKEKKKKGKVWSALRIIGTILSTIIIAAASFFAGSFFKP